MKRVLTLVAVLMLAAASFAGMPLTIGAGLNMSNLSFSGDYEAPDDAGMRIGFNVGVNTTIALNDKMGVLTGLAYETRGMTTETKVGDITANGFMKLSYLQIPVLFSYNAMPELALNVGPEIGIKLSATQGVTYDNAPAGLDDVDEDMEDVSTLDLGLSLGVNYTLMEKFVIGAGYYMGFMNIDNFDYDTAPDGSITNTNIKIMVGYKLAL
jgi:outer membrane immunogenic protein